MTRPRADASAKRSGFAGKTKEDLLYALYLAVSFHRANQKIAQQATRNIARAWKKINDATWADAGWTNKKVTALNKLRQTEHEKQILYEAKAIRARRRAKP